MLRLPACWLLTAAASEGSCWLLPKRGLRRLLPGSAAESTGRRGRPRALAAASRMAGSMLARSAPSGRQVLQQIDQVGTWGRDEG